MVCEWSNIFDVDTTGELWIPQNHPASIEGAVKTGNENNEGESYTGVANTNLGLVVQLYLVKPLFVHIHSVLMDHL